MKQYPYLRLSASVNSPYAAQLGAAARRFIVETLDIHHLLDREVELLRSVAEGTVAEGAR